MSETPKCPYCGEEMTVMAVRLARHNWIGWCNCENCLSVGPSKSNCYTEEEAKEVAASAAFHRAEPEMRPLTIEETQKQSETENVVWLEMVDDLNAMAAKVAQIDPANPRCFVYTLFNHFVTRKEDYGKTWRCWPRKPTPEQMAAAKWEE